MIFDELRILQQHGKTFIPDVTLLQLPGPFKGRPEISLEKVDEQALVSLCPTGAIGQAPVSIDMGKLKPAEIKYVVEFAESFLLLIQHRIADLV